MFKSGSTHSRERWSAKRVANPKPQPPCYTAIESGASVNRGVSRPSPLFFFDKWFSQNEPAG